MLSLSPSQKAWVMDLKSDPETSFTYALVEWKNGIPEDFRGQNIQAIDNQIYQLAHTEAVKGEPLQSPLPSPPPSSPPLSPKAEKPKEKIASGTPLAAIGPELLNALGDFVTKCQKNNTVHVEAGYRKLRIFSGKQPVPLGEEDFDTWIEQAMQALEGWEVPEGQKKQRISESLKGAAAEAVKNLRFSNSACTAYDYLTMLQEEFGQLEKVAELVYQFEHTLQQPGERLSEYVRRLNKMLCQIVLKKGMLPQVIDATRMKQILRGALRSDPVWLHLKTSEGVMSLSYPDLVRIIRDEEALLKDQQAVEKATPPPSVGVRSAIASERDSEVEILKSQMTQVLDLLTSLMAKNSGVLKKEEVRKEPHQSASTPVSPRDRGEAICFNCGGVGHFGRVCPSPRKTRGTYHQPAENSRGPR